MFFFFFQAEDGIRDVAVTGVQTCALPIYVVDVGGCVYRVWKSPLRFRRLSTHLMSKTRFDFAVFFFFRIGRASCRERV